MLNNEITDDPNSVGYAAMSDTEIATSLNTNTIAVKQAIETKKIKQYLLLVDKWLPIKFSTEVTALVTVDALNMFDEMDMTNPLIEAKVVQMMDGLIALSLINITDKGVILSMGDKTISRAESLGISTVTAGQVQAERNS